MLVPFENLDGQSKIWIYQSNRSFTEIEKDIILKKTELFLAEWTAHGHSLEAGVQIVYNQFIIIGINEAINEASGCSIDSSVNHIRELGKQLNIDLLEKSKVAIKNNTSLALVDFTNIKKMVNEGDITADTEVFNNTIVSKKELESNWIISAGDSWLKRYF